MGSCTVEAEGSFCFVLLVAASHMIILHCRRVISSEQLCATSPRAISLPVPAPLPERSQSVPQTQGGAEHSEPKGEELSEPGHSPSTIKAHATELLMVLGEISQWNKEHMEAVLEQFARKPVISCMLPIPKENETTDYILEGIRKTTNSLKSECNEQNRLHLNLLISQLTSALSPQDRMATDVASICDLPVRRVQDIVRATSNGEESKFLSRAPRQDVISPAVVQVLIAVVVSLIIVRREFMTL
jgi:hypothetical protein